MSREAALACECERETHRASLDPERGIGVQANFRKVKLIFTLHLNVCEHAVPRRADCEEENQHQ